MFEVRKNPKTPVIYKAMQSVNTKIMVQTPPTKGLESDLRKAIGGGHVDFDWTVKMYEIASTHIETVANYLVGRFGACELQIQSSMVELCTTQCQKATVRPVSECECVCGGHNHGDGWPEGWKLASTKGELLVKGERKIEIFTITKADLPVIAPIKQVFHSKPWSNDPYMDHVKAYVAAEQDRIDRLLQHPIGYVTEDGVEVVAEKNPFTGEMYKSLDYPEDHDYVIYCNTLDGVYRN